MMARWLCLAMLSVLPAAAQLRLFVLTADGEQPAPGLLDVGSAPVGEGVDARLRLRNTGSAAVTIPIIGLQGQGFTVSGYPPMPYVMAAGTNLDFRVTFRPPNFGAYSANLSVMNVSVILRGEARAAAVLSVQQASVGMRRLQPGETTDFGRVERRTTSVMRFRLENPASQAVNVGSLAVTGAAFRGPEGVSAPLALGPGETAEFQVTFAPANSGLFAGAVQLDGRSFPCTGTAFDPPLSRPALRMESGGARSGQQIRIGVDFPAPAPSTVSGKLRIEFTPARAGANADSTIAFTAGREASFTVREGEREARFGDANTATLQTGTTAGQITVVVEAGGYTERQSLAIAEETVVVDRVAARRLGGSLEVIVTGFDNTRSAAALAFTFTDRQGRPIGSTIRADAGDAMRRYFTASDLGGAFSLRAVFPMVSGSENDVADVAVEVSNALGAAAPAKAVF